RQSFEGHQRASVAGEVAARDPERRAVLSESAALAVRSQPERFGSKTRPTTFEAAWRSLNHVARTGPGSRPNFVVLEQLLTVREAAARLGISRASLYNLCTHHQVAHVRIGNAIR